MDIISKLEPKKVFQYFEAISNIPRCSGNEKAISDYMVSFAKKLGLQVIQDDVYNIIIKKAVIVDFMAKGLANVFFATPYIY